MPEDLLQIAPPPPDLRATYAPGAHRFGELRFGKGQRRHVIVMNIHGGFWRNRHDLQHAGHFCAALSRLGFTTWNIEYRRVGDDGGGWPGTLADVRLAAQFIPTLSANNGLQPSKVIVTGHSAGGHLALCLAAYEPSLPCVVSLAGVLDLQRASDLHLSADAVADFLGGSREQLPEFYRAADPMQLPIPRCTQVVIHGGSDPVVPADFSRSYFEHKRANDEDVRLIEIPAADHFDLIDPRSAAWTTVETAIAELAA